MKRGRPYHSGLTRDVCAVLAGQALTSAEIIRAMRQRGHESTDSQIRSAVWHLRRSGRIEVLVRESYHATRYRVAAFEGWADTWRALGLPVARLTRPEARP